MKEKKYYLFELKTLELNIISIVLLVFMFLLTGLIKNNFDDLFSNITLAFVFYVPYIMFHEVLHSIGYVLNGAKFKNVTYGVHLEKGVLCCLCKQNISRMNVLISLLYPFIFIGVITYVIGILTNNIVLVNLSILNISGCSGDLMMFLALSKIKNFEYSEYDDPTSFGLYTSDDLSNKKMLGLKYVGCVDKLKKEDLKKLDISIGNIIALILLIALGIAALFLKK